MGTVGLTVTSGNASCRDNVVLYTDSRCGRDEVGVYCLISGSNLTTVPSEVSRKKEVVNEKSRGNQTKKQYLW